MQSDGVNPHPQLTKLEVKSARNRDQDDRWLLETVQAVTWG
jgi:hypothetical protein